MTKTSWQMMKFKKIIQTKHGFTLVEILTAISILGFVIAALYTFLFAGLSSFNRGATKMDGQQSARIAMEKIVLELRCAVFVEAHTAEEIRFRRKNDSRVYRFRISGYEIVFESLRGHTILSHNKVALGINGLHFAVDQTNTVSIIVSSDTDSGEFSLSSRIRPRNIP